MFLWSDSPVVHCERGLACLQGPPQKDKEKHQHGNTHTGSAVELGDFTYGQIRAPKSQPAAEPAGACLASSRACLPW